MASERPDHTLEATALVHEAYVRLVDADEAQHWDSRGHFFAAAAEAMRRILVDNARRKHGPQRGGDLQRQDADLDRLGGSAQSPDVIAVDDALRDLAEQDPLIAKLVELRFFAGLTLEEAAAILGVSDRTADRYWSYAKAWLREAIREEGHP
jgi:RNA polymerase sigma factor (TIGR02999 family)